VVNELVDSFFNETNIPRNQRLQKYIKLHRFYNNLKTNTSTFQRPSSWEDPFEDFLSKLTNHHPNAYVNNLNITNGIYAQCWISKTTECDGMWRNFASLDRGIMIHTTLEKIITNLFQYLIDQSVFSNTKIYQTSYDIQNTLNYSVNIRKVKYLTDKKIADLFSQKTFLANVNYDLASINLLSKKRKEFEYENEYRLFISQENLKLPEVPFLELGYFNNSITKVVASPKMNEKDFEVLKQKLIHLYGFKNSQIKKSDLYNIDEFKRKYNL
jgi:hypothetical protein